MIRILKSEFYKLKHTWVPCVHIVLPVICALIFFGAAQVTGMKNLNSMIIIQTYLLLLSGALPIFCGMMTARIVEMEAGAGHFQVLLSTTRSRRKAYLGKLLVLLSGFFVALSLAIAVAALLFGHLRPEAWIVECILIFTGFVPVYIIHLWLSLRVGASASIGLGFVESLFAFLSITSLGDQIWYFIPCTWASRLSATYIIGSQSANCSVLHQEISMWAYAAVPLCLGLLSGSLFWFNRWDGQSQHD